MVDNPLTYIQLIAGLIGIAIAAARFLSFVDRKRHEAAHRRWTEQQEAQLEAGGSRFELQVFRKDRASLEWAQAQGRLRVTRDKPWGWYVVAETRLSPLRSSSP